MGLLALLIPPGDRWLLAAWALLCATSLAVLWSVTEPISLPIYQSLEAGVAKSVFYRQLVFMAVAFAGLLAAARLPLRHVDNVALPLYLGAILLLGLILVVGPAIGGSQRWLVLGPFRLQPSELAKVAFIIVTATLLGRAREEGGGSVAPLISLAVMLVPFALVLREPDLGTSLVFVAVWIVMVFWYGMPGILMLGAGSAALSAVIMFYSESVAGTPWPWGAYLLVLLVGLFLVNWNFAAKVLVLVLNLATGIAIPLLWSRLASYQQERIMAFFNPGEHAFDSGYQTIQSKVAIGSGGLFGTHYLQGTQKGLAFLPERHTDFIFSVVGEELGFVGAALVLGLFLVILLRGAHHAASARRPYMGFLAVGVVGYFTFHVVVNVSITTGLLPVTGLPLPLVSYGGSNLVVSSVLLGLLMNVSSRTFDG